MSEPFTIKVNPDLSATVFFARSFPLTEWNVFIVSDNFDRGDSLARSRQRMLFSGLAALALLVLAKPGTLSGQWPLQVLFYGLLLFFLLSALQWQALSERRAKAARYEPVLYRLDLLMVSAALWIAPEWFAFTAPLISVIALVRGLRYGPRSLGIHCGLGFAVFVLLYFTVPFWKGQGALLLTNLFLLTVLPLHFYTVSKRMHEHSRSLSEENLKDPLTRVMNRRALDNALWVALSDRNPFVLSFLDLDHFKRVNDSLGHAMGDKLLKRVCARLMLRMRNQDTLYRLAGDEFVLFSPGQFKPDMAEALGNRIRAAVSEVVSYTCPGIGVSASVGVLVVHNMNGLTPSQLIKSADELMYKAKKAGKDRVVVHTLQN